MRSSTCAAVVVALAGGLLSGCTGLSTPGSASTSPPVAHGPSARQVHVAERRVTRTVDRLSTLLEQQYAATLAYPRGIGAVRRLARSHHLLAAGTRVEVWAVHPIVRHEWFALCVQTSAAGQPVSGRYDSRSYGTVTAGVHAC